MWYPLLAFSGFFSSEQPYAGAIAVSTWLLVRQIEGGKNPVSLGVALLDRVPRAAADHPHLAALGLVGALCSSGVARRGRLACGSAGSSSRGRS